MGPNDVHPVVRNIIAQQVRRSRWGIQVAPEGL
jgi:hypothetical protein